MCSHLFNHVKFVVINNFQHVSNYCAIYVKNVSETYLTRVRHVSETSLAHFQTKPKRVLGA